MQLNSNGQTYDIINEIEVNGKKFFIVDPHHGKYVSGVLTRYLICPTAQFDKTEILPDKAEVV